VCCPGHGQVIGEEEQLSFARRLIMELVTSIAHAAAIPCGRGARGSVRRREGSCDNLEGEWVQGTAAEAP
jgi:hypothetical protein